MRHWMATFKWRPSRLFQLSRLPGTGTCLLPSYPPSVAIDSFHHHLPCLSALKSPPPHLKPLVSKTSGLLAVGPTPQKRATSSCQDHRPSSCMSPRHLFGSSHFVGHQAQFLGIVGFFSFPILTYLMDTERRCLVFDPVPAVAPQDTTHISTSILDTGPPSFRRRAGMSPTGTLIC